MPSKPVQVKVFTPAQEARIKEIIRELLPEITQAVTDQLQAGLRAGRAQT